MPDLDQFLDTLVADVNEHTRPPGAQAAIKRAHRRRTGVAAATVAGVACIAVGGGLAAGTLGGGDRVSPIEEPPTPSKSPTLQDTEPAPGSGGSFEARLRTILAQEPDWTVAGTDPMTLEPCGANWTSGATGGGGGAVSLGTSEEPAEVWNDAVGFSSPARAADAVAVLTENLASCEYVAWRTQPIPQSSAVLASSADGVVWILQKGANVSTLQVPTTDGPPTPDVQTEVANLIRSPLD